MRQSGLPIAGLLKSGVLAWALFSTCLPVVATPHIPAGDDVIVETLPVVAGSALEERRLRQALAQHPRDEATAIATAQGYLALARSQGDARYAGYAMGALSAWDAATAAQTPSAVLVMRATIAQFLHDFDAAEATLKVALSRQPGNAQAWITLATVLRVRGRYAESDAACLALGRVGPTLYGLACLAENAGLRGDYASARGTLRDLLGDPVLQGAQQASTRQWLLTSLAEVEELAGRPIEAEAFYRQAVQTGRSGYLLLAYSDFLLRQQRPAEVPALLGKEPRSDAVLLRLAIAARRTDSGAIARQKAEELQARFTAAALRPGNAEAHAREGALFALDVEGNAQRALVLARANVQLQREPIDLLLLGRAATAANDEEARRELRALMQRIGLRDARIDVAL